jgi:hypothetical protein
MTSRASILLALPLILLAACQSSDAPLKTTNQPQLTPTSTISLSPSLFPVPSSPIPFSTVPPSPTPLSSPTPTATPETILQNTQYFLDARLDYFGHTVSVSELVTYTNATGASLEALIFLAEPNRWPSAFALSSLTWGDGQPVAGYTLLGNQLRVPLVEPLPHGGQAILSIGYDLTLPAIPPPEDTLRPQVFGYTSRQTNLVDWYLFLPPYHPDQGWLAHEPGFFGEHQVYDLADYRVQIQRVDAGGEMVIAASAPGAPTDHGYRYTLDNARSFAWSAGIEYQVYTQTVGSVTVLSYAFPFDAQAAQAALDDTARAMMLYSELFGEYPHATLSLVEADFLDGMEYDGLYFLSRGFYNLYDGTARGYLTLIAAHETAHQWWYGRVGNDQALEPWLDESLCTYSERLFYEHYYPDLMDWWWAFRVDYYQPVGQVNSPIYAYGGFTPYRNAVYLRGALFLEDLRQLLGDAAFFAFLKDYATLNAGRLATTEGFFALLKTHTSADLSALITEYFAP